MTILDDYENELARQLRRVPTQERQAVVDEVRAHLVEAAAELRGADPGLSADEAMLHATHRFGAPEEVAAGYLPSAGEIRVGGVVLDVVRSTGRGLGRGALLVGRGTGRLLKWSVIALLVTMALVAAIAVTVLVVYDDEIKETVPRPVDDYHRTCTATDLCAGADRAATFDVGADVKEIRIQAEGQCSSGSARVQATDPSGDIVVVAQDVCKQGATKLFTEQGRWHIDVVYTTYVGSVDVEVWSFQQS